MTLLELNKIVEGKYPKGDAVEPIKTITIDDLENFRQYLAIDESMLQVLKSTNNDKEFFEAYPILNALPYSKEEKTELFYAAKLGEIYTDISSKLVYLLVKALTSTSSPNQALSVLKDYRGIDKYLQKGAIPNDITIKQIMSNILKSDFKVLTNSRRKVKYNNFYEVYVENVDTVVLLPEDIAAQVDSSDDLKAINYVKGVGVCVYDMPLRTFCGRLGVTTNEFDLRDVI